jgi:hypothetical protein
MHTRCDDCSVGAGLAGESRVIRKRIVMITFRDVTMNVSAG